MRPLKITLVGLVVLLAIAVGYGYGCGDSGDETAGSAATNAADETSASDATSASNDGAGDGSDGASDGSADGAVLQKSEFIEQGDVICRKVPATYEKLVQPLEKERRENGLGKPPVAEVNQKAAIPPLGPAIEEFEELTVPQGSEQEVEEIIEALKAAKKGLEEKPASELSGPKSPFDDFQNLTRAFGFSQCNRL